MPSSPARPILALALALVWCLLATAAGAVDEKAVYERARSDYHWLIKQDQAKKVYQNWQGLVDRFSRVYTANPQGPYAPGALFWMGRIHRDAHRQFGRSRDFDAAVDSFRRLTRHFPDHRLADDAQYYIGRMYEQQGDPKQAYLDYLRVTVNHPKGDYVAKAKKRLDALEKDLANTLPEPPSSAEAAPAAPAANGRPDPALATVSDLRHWSNPNYTRVVLSLERPVPYTTNLISRDEAHGKPRRLFVDLRGAYLSPRVQDTVPIGDGLLKGARLGQFTPDVVRLVLDIKHLESYKVFTLDNPFRLVLDCFGESPRAAQAEKRAKRARKVARGHAAEVPPTVGLAQALGLGVKRVVLDPGHGGKDPGAMYKGLKEKNIVLDIARRAAPKIKKLLGCQVLLTRSRDTFLPLEDRIAYANTHEADLFVSIHVNAAPSHRLSGIETYFLNLASDEESLRVAARENATTQHSISDLQVILNDLMLNSKINESNRLARVLHRNVLGTLRRRHKTRDLKVKQAPFYVLIGARMPAVLTEVGFMTNPTEHRLLSKGDYRDQLADGIALGVATYAKELKKLR